MRERAALDRRGVAEPGAETVDGLFQRRDARILAAEQIGLRRARGVFEPAQAHTDQPVEAAIGLLFEQRLMSWAAVS